MATGLTVQHARGSMVSPELPDYGTDIIKMVNAMLAAERARARAAGKGAGSLKVTGQGTVVDPETGEQTQVALHGTESERKAELSRLQQNAVNAALSNKLQGQAIGDISQMSVEKGEKTLRELQTNMVNELSQKAPALRQSFQQSVQNAFAPMREEINQRKKAIKESSNLDILGSSLNSAMNYARQLIETDERKGIQIARERAAQEAADRQNNAYLENQYRRTREGEDTWDRAMKGTGSFWLNTLGGALELAPAIAAPVAGGLALGAAGTAQAGPVGGIVGSAIGAGMAGAATGTADLYNRLVAEHPDWTDEQLLEAAKSGATTARLTGAATNAFLFPAGKILPKVPLVGRFARGTGYMPNMVRAYGEIAPMAAGYQMGQNWAYNQAVGRESTAENIFQGAGDAALAALPFAVGVGGIRGRMASGKAESATATTEGTDKKAITAQDMFKEARDNIAAEKKQAEAKPEAKSQEAQAKQTVQTIDPEVRTNTVESLFDLLSRETDADNINSTVRSLQDMEVSIDEIKQRVAGFAGENATSVQDYVNRLAEANSNLKDLQKGHAARQSVNDLLAKIGGLFTRSKKGNITGYEPSAVVEANRLLSNLPDGVTHEYVMNILRELAKPKGISKAAVSHANSATLKSVFKKNNTKSSEVITRFVDELRNARMADAMNLVNTASRLGESIDNVQKQAGGGDAPTGGENLVPVKQAGETGTPFENSGLNSELGTPEPGALKPAADGSVKETVTNNGNAKKGGPRGTAQPDDSTPAQTEDLTKANETVSGKGANRRPDSKSATEGLAEQGKVAGSNGSKTGRLERNPDDATGVGEQKPASGSDAENPVADVRGNAWIAARQDKEGIFRIAFEAKLKSDPAVLREAINLVNNYTALDPKVRSYLRRRIAENTDWKTILEKGSAEDAANALVSGSTYENYRILTALSDKSSGLSAKGLKNAQVLLKTLEKNDPNIKRALGSSTTANGLDDLVKQGYADSTNGGYTVKWQSMAYDATHGGKKGAKKQAAANEAFSKALKAKDPAESIVELRNTLYDNAALDGKTRGFLQKALDNLMKENESLFLGEQLSSVPNLQPSEAYASLPNEVNTAMKLFSLGDEQGARSTAKMLVDRTQRDNVPVQEVFDALNEYSGLANQTPAEAEKALRVMDELRKTYGKSLTVPEKVAEAIDAVCGR